MQKDTEFIKTRTFNQKVLTVMKYNRNSGSWLFVRFEQDCTNKTAPKADNLQVDLIVISCAINYKRISVNIVLACNTPLNFPVSETYFICVRVLFRR